MDQYIRGLEQQLEELQKKLSEAQERAAEKDRLAAQRDAENSAVCLRIQDLEEIVSNLTGHHLDACSLVAAMHEAAMGKKCGPKFGVVEDIAMLRHKYLALKKKLSKGKKHAKHRNRSV